MVLNVGVHGKTILGSQLWISICTYGMEMCPCSSLYGMLSIYPYRFVLMKRMGPLTYEHLQGVRLSCMV
jgi:hypothetical protein